MAKKLFHVASFGCRTNQADSASLRGEFRHSSYEETGHWERADVVVINSCTVTHRSDQQVRQLVRRFRRGNPSARLIVTGCYAQRAPSELAAIPGVDTVIGNTHKDRLVQLSSTSDGRAPDFNGLAQVYHDSFAGDRVLKVASARETGGRTRPFVRIQDGCDSACTYCIIPAVRGPGRSVPPSDVLKQVRRLCARGFQEIVLTGIHLGTYGRHLLPPFPLHRLLRDLLELPELKQLRLSSLEPMELSRKVIELAVQSEGKLAPHFHICLQSGCNRTLKRMLRPYTTRRYAGLVEEIRERIPEAGIGTDIIAGFPGEDEKEHLESLHFVEEMPLTYLHVFPYSDRSGTAASEMENKVDTRTIRRRCAEFRTLSEEKGRRFRRDCIGRRLQVLTLDDTEDGARAVITGNYLRGMIDPSAPPNRLLRLEVVGEERGRLRFGP